MKIMKIKVLLILFSFCSPAIYILSATGNPVYSKASKAKILLVNPDSFYLKSIDFLVSINAIDTALINFEAVFYSKCEVNSDHGKKFKLDHKINYLEILEVDGTLSIDNIYAKNDCSDEFKTLFTNSDGIIFFGGWDIPPTYYGQKTELLTDIYTPNRHLFELSFLYHLLGSYKNNDNIELLASKPKYMVLGICLGMQSMNVATGGDMYQDIPQDVYGLKYIEDVLSLDADKRHRNYNRKLYTDKELNSHSFHYIKILDKEILKFSGNSDPLVASSHHQAVNKTGKNMIIAATSIDGKVIEMLTHQKFPGVIGTQFHPEFFTLYDPNSRKVKTRPQDELLTEHEVLINNGSYQFHIDLWKYIQQKTIESANKK
jgi:putative glutamine amidotransferase